MLSLFQPFSRAECDRAVGEAGDSSQRDGQGPGDVSQSWVQGPSDASQEGIQGPSEASQEGVQGQGDASQKGVHGPDDASQEGVQGPGDASQKGIQGPGVASQKEVQGADSLDIPAPSLEASVLPLTKNSGTILRMSGMRVLLLRKQSLPLTWDTDRVGMNVIFLRRGCGS